MTVGMQTQSRKMTERFRTEALEGYLGIYGILGIWDTFVKLYI